MKPFDVIHTPLEGYTIIEASAGTGKTHAIADLYLRLLLEKGLSVAEILVVTFTEAATEELRDRIRRRLKSLYDVLTGVCACPAGDVLLEHCAERYTDSAAMVKHLHYALIDFDVAAICTIHGFCQRMLRDNAFESSALFDTELMADQAAFLQEIADDFWRRNFYTAPRQFMQYVMCRKYRPETFAQLILQRSIDPGRAVIPALERPDIDGAECAVQTAFDRLRESWHSNRPGVADIFRGSAALHRGKYRPDSLDDLLHEMDEYLDNGLVFPVAGGFGKFTASYIAAAAKKGCAPSRHPFFDQCEEFEQCCDQAAAVFEQYMLFLKKALFEQADRELKQKKHERNVRSFDDLLEDMYRALQTDEGALARAIRQKFKAALIDEFQDTDPVQYRIFDAIFGCSGHTLFMIGDPKQAIYSFRGADIYAYIKASAKTGAGEDFTLTANWRSDDGLLSALNALFAQPRNAFVLEQIQFRPIEPAQKKKQDRLILSGTDGRPLQIWFIDREHAGREDGVIAKSGAEPLIARTVAEEILRLVTLGQQGGAQLGGRALGPGDIAVLVRKNRQARMVQQELQLLSIPGVVYGAESIFSSREAEDVARVIAAVAEAGNETKIRAALVTDMLGLSGNDFQSLLGNEAEWENRLVRFHQYHEQWAQDGFIRMFRQLIREEGVRQRLLANRDGERRMTNLLHCMEVLHRAEVENSLGMDGLIKWFAAKRSEENSSEEEQIRLETDENAVKIITIHRSKGLEYPVVFCPFAWDSAAVKGDQFSFHDPAHDDRLTLDLGSGIRENRLNAERETLAENVRLLYVALTRAKHRCYLVWGKIHGAETAAPACLFHQPGTFSSDTIVEELGQRVKGLDYDKMHREVTALQEVSETIRVSRLPVLPREPYAPAEVSPDALAVRRFTGSIEHDWKIASYSSLTSTKSPVADQPDHDRLYDVRPMSPADSGSTDIFSFPRGANAGSCIHELLEEIDFSLADAAQARQLIAEKLNRYGLELRWQDVLWEMVQQLLHVPLEQERPDLILRNIGPRERLHELEFYFPLERITSPGLADVFASAGTCTADDSIRRMRELGFRPVQGYVRGFIDLVFRCRERYYIIDWKSNYLGASPGDYTQDALRKAMHEHYYILQYHIYTVALHHYLALRDAAYDYDKNFGGSYYCFVRGISRANGPICGIYRDRPSKDMVTALSNYLTGGQGAKPHG